MFLDDDFIVDIMSGSTWPILCMDSCGEVLVVLLFTDICLISVSLIPNNKSKINWNGQLLCGMAATGEMFRFGGILVLFSLHFMTVEKTY